MPGPLGNLLGRTDEIVPLSPLGSDLAKKIATGLLDERREFGLALDHEAVRSVRSDNLRGIATDGLAVPVEDR